MFGVVVILLGCRSGIFYAVRVNGDGNHPLSFRFVSFSFSFFSSSFFYFSSPLLSSPLHSSPLLSSPLLFLSLLFRLPFSSLLVSSRLISSLSFFCRLFVSVCLFVFIQDLLQYYTNLTQANIRGTPQWILEYKATSAFGIPDVTTQSLHKLAETFKEVGSENFKKYYKFNSVSYDEECNATCKVSQICAITKVDFDEYDSCVSPPAEAGANGFSRLVPGPSSLLALTLTVILTRP